MHVYQLYNKNLINLLFIAQLQDVVDRDEGEDEGITPREEVRGKEELMWKTDDHPTTVPSSTFLTHFHG